MSRSATPATRNEATRSLKPIKSTPSAELTIGTAIRPSRERLRTVAGSCERKRNVERTHPEPPDHQSETGTLATHSGKHSVSRLSNLFAYLHLLSSDSFSSLIFSLLIFSSLTLPTSAFPSVHIVGSLTSKLPSINVYYTHIYIYTISVICSACMQLLLALGHHPEFKSQENLYGFCGFINFLYFDYWTWNSLKIKKGCISY